MIILHKYLRIISFFLLTLNINATCLAAPVLVNDVDPQMDQGRERLLQSVVTSAHTVSIQSFTVTKQNDGDGDELNLYAYLDTGPLQGTPLKLFGQTRKTTTGATINVNRELACASSLRLLVNEYDRPNYPDTGEATIDCSGCSSDSSPKTLQVRTRDSGGLAEAEGIYTITYRLLQTSDFSSKCNGNNNANGCTACCVDFRNSTINGDVNITFNGCSNITYYGSSDKNDTFIINSGGNYTINNFKQNDKADISAFDCIVDTVLEGACAVTGDTNVCTAEFINSKTQMKASLVANLFGFDKLIGDNFIGMCYGAHLFQASSALLLLLLAFSL